MVPMTTDWNGYYTNTASNGTSLSIDFGSVMDAAIKMKAMWSYTSAATTAVNGWGYAIDDFVYAVKPSKRVGYKQVPQSALLPRLAVPRAFNKYTNASDLLEEFIRFLGKHDVRQGEVRNLPLDLFIKWLIIRACEQDNEPSPVTLELPAKLKQPRCLGCGRWTGKALPAPFHDARCAGFFYARQSNIVTLSTEIPEKAPKRR